ncbi:MAG: alpha/beta hydrolase [Cytophagaceae bacterium]|nr:alpha/beta hydrolase [Cytophagaceae bacterium]
MHFPRYFWLLALLLLPVLLLLGNEFAIAYPSHRTKNIAYLKSNTPGFDADRHQLDVYAPRRKPATLQPVVVFVHGGAWNSGSKNIYSFIGRRLAKQGVVAVIINYRLSPQVQVPAMADDCARAVLWATRNIAEFGGDPTRIYVMGHSAGGGLAALLASDDRLFARLGLLKNPVRGAILDDPGGVDMNNYLQKMEYPGDESYLTAFGRDSTVWRRVSPIYYVSATNPPVLVFVGGKTYPGIKSSTARFREELKKAGARFEFTVLPGKKHIPMVLQLFWKNNVIYKDLLRLVRDEKQSAGVLRTPAD